MKILTIIALAVTFSACSESVDATHTDEVSNDATDNASTDATSQALADELAVQRIPTELEVAVDNKDWERARSFFADEIDVDFSSLSGAPPARIPADDLVSAWATNLGPHKHSHHQRGGALVTLEGDSAVVYSQGYAWNRMEGNGDPLWEVWGNYTHEL
ncbi:MAG: nuclear transport factor 2 family protein, partial [Myxococcota bacterium]